ncbi:MAG: inorganic pyrophosphatase [Acidimicrobiales bacterium]|nr:MAG: inorganic pyrophosphatase [Acidimicrobiales bacterium]
METSQPVSECIEVVVEIPRGSRNKYEMDHETGVIRLDRRLFSATVYPADYGFIPETLAEDGDPLDALVLVEDPTFPGCHVTARPVGMLVMEDEKGRDVKIISVPPHEPRFAEVLELDDLHEELLAEIRHFFEVYKTLEPRKHSVAGDYLGRDAAWAEIQACRRRFAERKG